MKEFPLGFCRKLLSGESNILERFGEKLQYDITIGYNGRIWIKGSKPSHTILIINAFERLVEMGDSNENIDFIME